MGSNDIAIIPPKKLPSILFIPKYKLKIESISLGKYELFHQIEREKKHKLLNELLEFKVVSNAYF